MRIVAAIAVAAVLSLACVGTYVVNAQWTRRARLDQLGQSQSSVARFLGQDFTGQLSGSLPRVADLEATARKAINGFQTLNFDQLYEALPSWKKERVALQQARHKARIEADSKLSDADIAQQVKMMDPKETLRVTGRASYMGLTRAQYFALSQGLLKLHDNEAAVRSIKGEWFMVDASIGMIIGQMSGSMGVLQNGAMVTFENIPGDRIKFTVLVLDDAWVVSSWDASVGSFKSTTTSDDERYQPSYGAGEAKSSEARAALGTIKDRLRVKYIQNNNDIDLKWTLNDLVNVSELDGKYYSGSDYSMSNLTKTSAVLQAAANETTGSPQVTMTITNIASGAATITSP